MGDRGNISQMRDRVLIILLNYNTWQRTVDTVDMLINTLCIAPDDILVVDNASTNDSYEQLQSRQADLSAQQTGIFRQQTIGFHLYRAEQNEGYAAGNNIGIRYARQQGYQYAWILNNDILIDDKDILNKMLYIIKNDPKTAIVNPDIYSSDGHMFNREAKRPTFWDHTFGMFRYRKLGRQIADIGGYGYVYRPQGCCMLVDLKKLEEAGDLDEHTFLYGEEVILAERLLKKDYLCACCMKGRVIHNHSSTVKDHFTKKKLKDMKLKSFRYYLTEYRGYPKWKMWIASAFYGLKLDLLELCEKGAMRGFL